MTNWYDITPYVNVIQRQRARCPQPFTDVRFWRGHPKGLSSSCSGVPQFLPYYFVMVFIYMRIIVYIYVYIYIYIYQWLKGHHIQFSKLWDTTLYLNISIGWESWCLFGIWPKPNGFSIGILPTGIASPQPASYMKICILVYNNRFKLSIK